MSLDSPQGVDGGQPSRSQIRVLVADDHDIVRQGLKALLQAEGDMTVVAEAETGREAVELAARLRPQVVLMDLAMPQLNGWEAARQILRLAPATKVIVLSTYHDDHHVEQAIAAGAVAYLIKESAGSDLVKAIREAIDGNSFFSPLIAKRLGERIFHTERAPMSAGSQLTSREAEVLQLIAEGSTNKGVAYELGLSVKTVEKHRQSIMNKLNIHNTAGLVHYAANAGVVEVKSARVPAALEFQGRSGSNSSSKGPLL